MSIKIFWGDSVYYLYKISYLWWYMFLNTYGIGYKMRWVRISQEEVHFIGFFWVILYVIINVSTSMVIKYMRKKQWDFYV